MGRAANGESSIRLGRDGRWHGYVSMGKDVCGKPVRPHVSSRSRQVVADEVARLERERDRASGRSAARKRKTSVGEYIVEWLEVVEAERAPGTWHAYRNVVRNYVKGYPLYNLALSNVTIREIDRWLIEVTRRSGAMAALKARRTISAMFGHALRRGMLAQNPVTGSLVPRAIAAQLVPFDTDEISQILRAAQQTDMPARWSLAFAKGLRQGECTGVRRDDVDLVRNTVTIAGKLQALPWMHGCVELDATPTCGRVAKSCPLRHGGGMHWQPYTKTGKHDGAGRVIEVPSQVMEQLAHQMDVQDQQRESAGDRWTNSLGLLFTGPSGQPIRPEADNKAWHDLLSAAGVRQMKLHGARHSTATAMLGRIDPRIVVELMGWSGPAMLQHYQIPGTNARRAATDALWRDLYGN